MAVYASGSTVAVTGTAANLVTNGKEMQIYELQSTGVAFWFKAGPSATASVDGADCVFVPALSGVEVKLSGAGDEISAIKHTGESDGKVVVSVVTS